MKVSRSQRLSSEYQKEIAHIISTTLKYHNPEINGLISVTKADVATDLKNATVFISIYGVSDEKKQQTFNIIKDSAGFIRHELSLVMNMRTVPTLHFMLDESLAYGDKIDKIIKQIHKD